MLLIHRMKVITKFNYKIILSAVNLSLTFYVVVRCYKAIIYVIKELFHVYLR